jgi:amidase
VTATASATELARAIRSKELGSLELLELYVHRIERLDGDVNAVATLDLDRARDLAADADAATARGDDLGPLHGLPITVKDAIETEGIRSTGGATELADHIPAADAPAVDRLKDAGAIVFGKTNLPRWSGDLQTFNDLFGTTSNPWSSAHSPGGSSGGAAAAVAAGFTSFELGTDIAGSVRGPSHCCGVFGLKPTWGVVPTFGYLDHVGGGTTEADTNVFGPIARSAPDLDLLLSVLAGPVGDEATGWRLDLPAAEVDELSGLRVATWLDDPACSVDREYGRLLNGAADVLADAGAQVVDDHPPTGFDELLEVFFHLVAAATSPSSDEPPAWVHVDWLVAQERRAALRRTWADWFRGHDVLLLPAQATPAIEHDHAPVGTRTITVDGRDRSDIDLLGWLGVINMLGLPSTAAPIGLTAAGLPAGIQVVAPRFHDRRTIRVADLLTQHVGGYRVPPGFE